MTSPAKRKGSAWERDVAAYLREHGFPHAERALGAGRRLDRGDVDGLPMFAIECKAEKSIDLAGWTNEAEAERVNRGTPYGVVVAKRRGKSAADAYVVLTLAQFARLALELDGREVTS